MKPTPGSGIARYRWAVVSRTLAAVFGGYALAAATAASLAIWLPMARVEAVVTASMLGFVAYVVGVLWVFAASNAWRAWRGIMAPTLLLAGMFWLGSSLEAM